MTKITIQKYVYRFASSSRHWLAAKLHSTCFESDPCRRNMMDTALRSKDDGHNSTTHSYLCVFKFLANARACPGDCTLWMKWAEAATHYTYLKHDFNEHRILTSMIYELLNEVNKHCNVKLPDQVDKDVIEGTNFTPFFWTKRVTLFAPRDISSRI